MNGGSGILTPGQTRAENPSVESDVKVRNSLLPFLIRDGTFVTKIVLTIVRKSKCRREPEHIFSRHEEIRRRRGYTVTGLARALGFSHAYVSRVEGGQVPPSPRYRRAVSKLLKVPEEFLFGEL